MIKVSTLKHINSPRDFFNIDKVLYADLVHVGSATDTRLKDIIGCKNIIIHKGQIYHTVIMVGEPHNFFLNATKGVPFNLGHGVEGVIKWRGGLMEALEDQKFYDFSKYHANYKQKGEKIAEEPEFYINKYLTGSNPSRTN